MEARMMQEEWRPVPGFQGLYEVSNTGRVRSLDRDFTDCLGRNRKVTGRVLVLVNKPDGYKGVSLNVGGQQIGRNVHRLVAMAFLGPPPFDGAQVNHKDGDKSNNIMANLEWCSGSENQRHAFRTGLRKRGVPIHLIRHGEENPACKLTDHQVGEIRRRLDGGAVGADIAREYRVSTAQVSRIRNRTRRQG